MGNKIVNLQHFANDSYLFGEIKLWYDANKHKKLNCIAVVVEAKANEILFRKLLHKNCQFFSAHGWVKVVTALHIAKKNQTVPIIGIIDADFKRVTNYQLVENLFLTDSHDTEIMLAHSESWSNVLNYYVNTEKLDKFETKNKQTILDYLLKILQPLSILRFLNEKNGLNLVFRTQKDHKYEYLKYKTFIDVENLHLNFENLLKAVENKSNLPNYFKNNPAYKIELANLLGEDRDLKEFTNGHDLTNVLAIAFENAIGKKANKTSVTGEDIEQALIIAYRLSDFEQTVLYKKLQEWEAKNTLYKILQ